MLATFNTSGFFAAVCQRFQFSLFISCLACLAWLSCLTVVIFRVEQRLQVLEATNVEIKDILATQSDRLETLEMLFHKLKSSLIALHNKKDELDSDLVSSNLSNNQTIWNHKIFRTCHEMRLADSSLTSGLHWIDPDGQGIGDNPIEVYCNMTTGTTSILHDSESPTKVKYCIDPGCDSKSIKYFATERQIFALESFSGECHQTIKYDCFHAPLQWHRVVYSWWNDRNGNPQYFWAGSNSSIHTCQCGISGNCAVSYKKCNCDSHLSVSESDHGVITNKFLLPVTRLNFGSMWFSLFESSGVYTLGRFECSGQRELNGMPSSCDDLRRLGHSVSGLYSVMGATMIENIYCDFSKLANEEGFEKRLGYVDVKSIPTYFYVQKTKTFNELGSPVPFDNEVINTGGAMNLTSGIFTAPRTGKYSFTFSGLARFTSTNLCRFRIDLFLNDKNVGLGWAERENGSFIDYFTISLQSTLDLKAGDRVWLQIREILDAFLNDNGNHHTHFSGQLLQEDISQLFH